MPSLDDPLARGSTLLYALVVVLLCGRALIGDGASTGRVTSSADGWWILEAAATGSVVVISALVAVWPRHVHHRPGRVQAAISMSVLILGLGECAALPGPSGAIGPDVLPVACQMAGLAVLAVAAALLVRGPAMSGWRAVLALSTDAVSVWLVLAVLAVPTLAWAMGPSLLAPSPAQAISFSTSTALLAVLLAIAVRLRSGWHHVVVLVIAAVGMIWVVDLVQWMLPGEVDIATTLQLSALPVLAVAAGWAAERGPLYAARPAEHDVRSVAVPLLGGSAAVFADVFALSPLWVNDVSITTPMSLLCLMVASRRAHALAVFARRRSPRVEELPLDHLTGLLNRRGLQMHVSDSQSAMDVLAIDLDGLRRVNEEAGEEVGDQVLIWVAGELNRVVPARGLAARLGGDDFALAVPAAGPDAARSLAAEVQHRLNRPLDVSGHRLYLRVDIGIVLGHPSSALLRCAGMALATAQASPSGVAEHEQRACQGAIADPQLQIVADLHAALVEGTQLLVHLQPQHRLDLAGLPSADTVVGCEALLRWQHPTRGLLGPPTVLRAARAGHLGRALSDRVLDLALEAAATWWTTHRCPVAINLTTDDLDDDQLPHVVAAALRRHGLPAAALSVEVVEDSLMIDPVQATRTLSALRQLGIHIALDDYGTGYSSLAWLHRLPVDEVKFDRSLTAGIADDTAATAIVRHSVRLAHDLGLVVLAEGVERPRDLDLLRDLGCDAVQGYLTGRPMHLLEWHTALGGVAGGDTGASARRAVKATSDVGANESDARRESL